MAEVSSDMVTVQEAAAILGVSIQRTYSLIYDGKLPALESKEVAIRTVFRNYLPKSAVLALLEERGKRGKISTRPHSTSRKPRIQKNRPRADD